MDEDELTLIQAGEDPNYGFSNLPTGVKGAAGLGLIGASTAMMRGQTPGGIRRAAADYASNYLDTFYSGGQANKIWQYSKELAKTGGRITADSTYRLLNSEFYNKTGVSPVVIRDIDNMDLTKKEIKSAYMNNKIRKDVALNTIKKSQKIAWAKVTSDKANQLIFFGKASPEINRIVGDNVKLTNAADFTKSAGGLQEANYALTRHAKDLNNRHMLDLRGLRFIKYKDKRFANVMQGVQFDPRMYNTMLELKRNGSIYTAPTILQRIPGIKNVVQMGDKFLFELHGSPKFKSNFDWGGYNAVGIWDSNARGKIRFIATDVPNTPLPKTGGKVPGIKYVDTKEVTITEPKLKEIFEDKDLKEIKPNNRGRPKGSMGKGRKLSDLDFNPVIGKESFQNMKDLQSKRNSFTLGKAKILRKLGRRLPGAAGAALMAWDLFDYFRED